MTVSTSLRWECPTRTLRVTASVFGLLIVFIALSGQGAAIPAAMNTSTAVVDSVDDPVAQTPPSSAVRLSPTDVTVDEGDTVTLDVVVANATGGVGAIEGSIQVVDPSTVDIVEYTPRGAPDLTNITQSEERVDFRAALMNTSQSGPVVVGEITLKGRLEGSSNVRLSVSALSTETGTPYQIGATAEASVSVENVKNTIPLQVTPSKTTARIGEDVTFTVTRLDSDVQVRATVSVGGQTINTGADGNVTITITSGMVNDAGSVTVRARKTGTSEETFLNDSATVEIVGGQGNATSGNAVTVGFSSSSITIAPETRTTIGVVISNVENGIGAANIELELSNPGVASIANVTPLGSPGIRDITVGSNGASASARLALMDTADSGEVRVMNITLVGAQQGATNIELSVNALGDESGNSYRVGATPNAAIRVADSSITATATRSTGAANTDGSGTTASISDTHSSATEDSGTVSVPGFNVGLTVVVLFAAAMLRRYRRM